MNLSTIAKLAGVSVATVSKAFAGNSEISEKTKERIYEISRQNGCFDKYIKNKYPKKVIAVIYPEIRGDYYSVMVDMLEKAICEKGAVMVSSISNFSGERERELFAYYSAYAKVDGIIIVGMQGGLNNSINIPLVALSSHVKCPHADVIRSDIDVSIDQAVECLKNLGHTQIGFAGERLTITKQELFKLAMEKHGLLVKPANIKVSEGRFEEAGVEMMEQWFEEGHPPTAILAAYDNIAIGLVRVITRRGYRVPEDFSIIGIDDIFVAPYMNTSISSIRTYTEESCRAAVELIMKKIDNQHYTMKEEITIKTELIIRESVGKVREKEM